MDPTRQGASALDEVKSFVAFLQNLWGVLAGVSVLFPLSNVLAQVVPLGERAQEQGGLAYASPALTTAVTTVVALFVILWTFGQRGAPAHRRSGMSRAAWLCLLGGLACLVVYLSANTFAQQGFYHAWWGWSTGDPQYLVSDLVLVASYSAFFALVTRAFVLLGLREFLRGHRTGDTSSPGR